MLGRTMTEAADKVRHICPTNVGHWEVVAEACQ